MISENRKPRVRHGDKRHLQASEETLGETVALVNCFMEQARLDQPLHIAAGMPDTRAAAAPTPGVALSAEDEAGAFTVDLGGALSSARSSPAPPRSSSWPRTAGWGGDRRSRGRRVVRPPRSGWARARFTIDLPASLPLHELRLKRLVAALDDVDFAARTFFVLEGDRAPRPSAPR